jgi:excisionase family DNA binding protein
VEVNQQIMSNISPKNELPSILTLANVADFLQVHPSTVYRLLKKKQLPAFKLGRDWRFNKESIDRWRTEAERGR